MKRPSPPRPMTRSGFTLAEMLVVIGIITLIIGIALPVTFKARRQAARTRALRDLETLRTGLEEFKNVNNQYPQMGLGGTVATGVNNQGALLLYCALTGLRTNGLPDPSPLSGRPRQALINMESFRVNAGQIMDANSKPYLYFAGVVPTPTLTSASGGLVRGYTTPNSNPSLYNQYDAPAGTLSLSDMQKIMGDTNNNGYIDGSETPSSTAPYLLWGAGPDGAFGLDVNGKTDDVTNFTIPAQYSR